MHIYITNAYSLQMLPAWRRQREEVTLTRSLPVLEDPLTVLEGLETLAGKGAISAVGHRETAAVISSELGRPVAMNRVSITLDDATVLLVAQFMGGRIPEGATALPDHISTQWTLVWTNPAFDTLLQA